MGAHVDPKSGLTLDQTALLAYPQVEHIDHVHHAGNSSGVVDGAGAVLVASRQAADAERLDAAGQDHHDGDGRHRAGDHAHRARARPPSAASRRPA